MLVNSIYVVMMEKSQSMNKSIVKNQRMMVTSLKQTNKQLKMQSSKKELHIITLFIQNKNLNQSFDLQDQPESKKHL